MADTLPTPPPTPPLTAAERRLALWLRGLAMFFGLVAVGALVRADETVRNLNAIGGFLHLPVVDVPTGPVASDFWFALAVADMATNAVCAWLASTDVRGRRAFAYPVVVSHLASAGTALLLIVRWSAAFPIVSLFVVDLAIAVIVISALRATPRT